MILLVFVLAKQWFGPYIVNETYDNVTCLFRDSNGKELKISIASNWVQLFREKNKDDEDDNGHVWEGHMFNEVKAKGVDSAYII